MFFHHPNQTVGWAHPSGMRSLGSAARQWLRASCLPPEKAASVYWPGLLSAGGLSALCLTSLLLRQSLVDWTKLLDTTVVSRRVQASSGSSCIHRSNMALVCVFLYEVLLAVDAPDGRRDDCTIRGPHRAWVAGSASAIADHRRTRHIAPSPPRRSSRDGVPATRRPPWSGQQRGF